MLSEYTQNWSLVVDSTAGTPNETEFRISHCSPATRVFCLLFMNKIARTGDVANGNVLSSCKVADTTQSFEMKEKYFEIDNMLQAQTTRSIADAYYSPVYLERLRLHYAYRAYRIWIM